MQNAKCIIDESLRDIIKIIREANTIILHYALCILH